MFGLHAVLGWMAWWLWSGLLSGLKTTRDEVRQKFTLYEGRSFRIATALRLLVGILAHIALGWRSDDCMFERLGAQ